jgi:hypothetical protein
MDAFYTRMYIRLLPVNLDIRSHKDGPITIPVLDKCRPEYPCPSVLQEITDATARLHGGPRERGGVVACGVVAATDDASDRLLGRR